LFKKGGKDGEREWSNFQFNLFDFLFVPAYTGGYGHCIQKKNKETEKNSWFFGSL